MQIQLMTNESVMTDEAINQRGNTACLTKYETFQFQEEIAREGTKKVQKGKKPNQKKTTIRRWPLLPRWTIEIYLDFTHWDCPSDSSVRFVQIFNQIDQKSVENWAEFESNLSKVEAKSFNSCLTFLYGPNCQFAQLQICFTSFKRIPWDLSKFSIKLTKNLSKIDRNSNWICQKLKQNRSIYFDPFLVWIQLNFGLICPNFQSNWPKICRKLTGIGIKLVKSWSEIIQSKFDIKSTELTVKIRPKLTSEITHKLPVKLAK